MSIDSLYSVKRFVRRNSSPPWVALLGSHGSGKSTVLKALESDFNSPLFTGVKTIYRRLDFLGQPPKAGGPVIDHYAHPLHGRVKSVVKLGIRALDWLLGYWSRWKYQRARGYLLLLDRHYFLDVSVDPLRYRYGGPLWLARLLGDLLPGPDLFILLDAPVEVVRNRKQEVSLDEGIRQRAAYLRLVQTRSDAYVVDASKPLPQVVADVKTIILNYINENIQIQESQTQFDISIYEGDQ